MDRQTTMQAALTAAFAGLIYYLGLLAVPIMILLVVMIIDYITGMISAWHNHNLSSRIGMFGIIKKICYLFAVVVAMGVDWLIYSGLSMVGITLDYTIFFGILVTIWLIINELISILENLYKIGVPLPKFLTTIVSRLKQVVEETNESEEK